jgi:hypothetical protein
VSVIKFHRETEPVNSLQYLMIMTMINFRAMTIDKKCKELRNFPVVTLLTLCYLLNIGLFRMLKSVRTECTHATSTCKIMNSYKDL